MPREVECVTLSGPWSLAPDLIVGLDVEPERAESMVEAGESTRCRRRVPDRLRLKGPYQAPSGITYALGDVLAVGQDVTPAEGLALLRIKYAWPPDAQKCVFP